MPNLIQLNNVIQNNKGYSPTLGNRAENGEQSEQFDVAQLTKPTAVKGATDGEAGSGRAQLAGAEVSSARVQVAKDPTMAVDTLKDIINEEVLANAKINGYTDLYGDLDALTKNLYLKTSDLVTEIQNQEQQNTVFSGSRFFDILRDIVSSAELSKNQDLKAAVKENVAGVLKAMNFAQTKTDILSALSSNMKYLSEHFSSNTALSMKFYRLSLEWAKPSAAQNFEQLKASTGAVLKEASGSILNNEHSRALLPLVTHNLSRYNDNENMLREAFSQLLTQVASRDARKELTAGFNEIMKKLIPNNPSNPSFTHNPDITSNPSNTKSPSTTGNSNRSDIDENITVYHGGGMRNDPVDETTSHTNNTTNVQKNQPQNSIFSKESQIPEFLGTQFTKQSYINSLNLDKNSFDAPLRSLLLGKTDGTVALKNTLMPLFNDENAFSALSYELDGIDNVEDLVEYLNNILKELPEFQGRDKLFESLTEIVTHIADNNELKPHPATINRPESDAPAEKPTTLDGLTSFIEKNINHSALKSIDNYNASNLLQSMLNAPGVETPLAHYIIPLQIENTKAFGELWVDNNEENHTSAITGGKRNYHIFLTFDVDAIGRFEVNLMSNGENVDISLLHPESFGERVKPLVGKINRIIAGTGYVSQSFNTGVLEKPHSLTEVFPILKEKRAGLNVKA